MRDVGRLVPQGAMIPAVLETAIDSDLPGSVRAVVSREEGGERHFQGAGDLGERLQVRRPLPALDHAEEGDADPGALAQLFLGHPRADARHPQLADLPANVPDHGRLTHAGKTSDGKSRIHRHTPLRRRAYLGKPETDSEIRTLFPLLSNQRQVQNVANDPNDFKSTVKWITGPWGTSLPPVNQAADTWRAAQRQGVS